jgi:(S)-ureidoglycine aminohydrolase
VSGGTPADKTYGGPIGGAPPQTDLLSGRAIFTEAYAVIPRGVQRDIVTSALPFWDKTRAWILASPMRGFAETFAELIVEVAPGGGSARP